MGSFPGTKINDVGPGRCLMVARARARARVQAQAQAPVPAPALAPARLRRLRLQLQPHLQLKSVCKLRAKRTQAEHAVCSAVVRLVAKQSVCLGSAYVKRAYAPRVGSASLRPRMLANAHSAKGRQVEHAVCSAATRLAIPSVNMGSVFVLMANVLRVESVWLTLKSSAKFAGSTQVEHAASRTVTHLAMQSVRTESAFVLARSVP